MNVQCHACIGGTNIGEDIRKLDYGQHIVSGTPGRVFGNYATKFNKIVLYMKHSVENEMDILVSRYDWPKKSSNTGHQNVHLRRSR